MVRRQLLVRLGFSLQSAASVAVGLALSACAAEPESAPGREVAVTIAPLDLAGVTNACFTLSVHNGPPTAGGELVWTQANVCADNYGDGSGSVAYVGPCDASVPNNNVVSLVLQDLYAGTPAVALTDADFTNPCPSTAPCRRSVACLENQDAAVDFELTVMRAANQGFFDIAVNFADVFCSAKFDCTDGDGALELLHDPATGQRGPTGVLGFACTSGNGEPTWMHLDDLVITCSSGTTQVDGSPGVCADDLTFEDAAFSTPQWEDGFIANGLAPITDNGTIEVAQVVGGGNTGADPDPFLVATIFNRGGTNTVHTYALMPTATWNPATQGAITHISAQYDIRLRSVTGTVLPSGPTIPVQPSLGGNAQFAIRQNGVIYAPSLGAMCPLQTDCDTWRTKDGAWSAVTQIGALSNAILGPGDPAAPPIDFTSSGAPITFGVLIGLSGGSPAYNFDWVYEIDNFSVALEVDCTTPEPGNAGPVPPGTFQTAVYFGREEFAGLNKCYWNVALGLKLGDGALGNNCVLETRGSASPNEFAGGASPANSNWPVIHWLIPITGSTGALACGTHPLNVPGSGVATEYTQGTAEVFDRSRLCEPPTTLVP